MGKEILAIHNEGLTVNLGQDFIGVHTYYEDEGKDRLTLVSFENFHCFSTTLNDWKRTKVVDEVRLSEIMGVGVKVTLLIGGEVEFVEVYVLRKVRTKETSLIVNDKSISLTNGFIEVSKKQ